MQQNPSRRHLLAAAAALSAGGLARPHVARAQAMPKLRFALDWAKQGPNAYATMALEKGYFREVGLDATVDRGFGSGRVPVDIAGGAYDMGQADINPVIKFMAENPNSGLVVTGIWGDRSLLCAVTRADGGVRAPKDLEGRTLAAPESDAGRQLFPAFAKMAGVDAGKVNWMSVSPELREPMLVQKRADGVTGAITSVGMSLKALGLDFPQQNILYYRDHGLDLLGTAYITTKAFAEKNPEVVRNAQRALFRGLIYANRNRAESIAALKKAEPLTDVAIETERQAISMEQQVISDHVMKNGLSNPDMPRFQKAIEAVEGAYGLPNRLKVADIYTDAFLPPIAERRL
ncbi:ABC transporter substrate-binding protein [Pararoseomonas indoligenes]|uniref:Thiamine pyrimidine synthase n=1 Tax=Roseomonas indoligenes TaxID=2820811 RepID=A0A940MUW1_9PROT|nr:ABC transporter substrate-binding protein [Pararoseomonas indoligenes]MBP0491385.1 ABC transporter substrate-binding protein [Pararoseomonas indoligenes]